MRCFGTALFDSSRPAVQMLMDPMGGIVMTSDGNAILREVQPS